MCRASTIRNWLVVVVCGLLCLALPAPAATTTPAKKSATTASTTSAKSSTVKGKQSRAKTKARSSKKRGQAAIDSTRARQIQTALIREHYMEGAPSGTWDAATQAAMKRYQADQGWQSKQIPDSRALIKLGLGPSHDHLLNPESAMTTAPRANDPKVETKQRTADSMNPSSNTPGENKPQQ